MEAFDNVKLIGEGTYGKVYRGVDKKLGKTVAIKRVGIDKESGFPFTTIREIKMLKKLNSPNIVGLNDIYVDNDELYIVMEFLPFDLTGLIYRGYKFTEPQIKSLTCQLIKATKYIHSFGMIHRDIKASNILINQEGLLKLADFGLTREMSNNMTNRVCTLWYRAPELLLGSTSYDTKVDSWSIGCVIVEMRTGKAPFRANDEINQIKVIFEKLGAPQEEYKWSRLLNANKYIKREEWDKIIYDNFGKYFDDEMLLMVGEFLRLSPRERISAANSLKLGILTEYKDALIPINMPHSHEYYTKHMRNKADN
ncbi:putative cell division protein kinase [Astathelohania contejeani]|uniref:Cell division protein kinase n=1 Tax=Astathelohania contejeani TaxID=164912 RepID=A0ABQ7HZ69_9MICR|nr:putative cell division protein kinase [Thelohania contejeani]